MQSVPFCSKKHIIRSDSRSGKEPQFSDCRTPSSFPAHPKGLRHTGESPGLEDLQVRLQLQALGKRGGPWIFSPRGPPSPEIVSPPLLLGRGASGHHPSCPEKHSSWRAGEMLDSGPGQHRLHDRLLREDTPTCPLKGYPGGNYLLSPKEKRTVRATPKREFLRLGPETLCHEFGPRP